MATHEQMSISIDEESSEPIVRDNNVLRAPHVMCLAMALFLLSSDNFVSLDGI